MLGFPQIPKRVRILSLFARDLMRDSMESWPQDIERDSPVYRSTRYRASWQPLWAIVGIILCLLLLIFAGWNAVYELCRQSPRVPTSDSMVDLIFIYIGVSFLDSAGKKIDLSVTSLFCSSPYTSGTKLFMARG